MRFSLAALGLFFAATSAAAVEATPDFDSIYKPAQDEVVKAGAVVSIAWTIKNTAKYENEKVDIQVLGGKDPQSLALKHTIASGVDNSLLSYKWLVNSTLGTDKTYGIKILLSSDETVYQWSNHFKIEKKVAEGGSSSTTGSSTASSGTESSTSSGSATKTTRASTTATASTSKSDKTTASSATSAAEATTPAKNGTATTTTSATRSPTPSQGAAAGFTAGAGVAAAVVGFLALLAF